MEKTERKQKKGFKNPRKQQNELHGSEFTVQGSKVCMSRGQNAYWDKI